MAMQLRMGILEADPVDDVLAREFGNYPVMFQRLLEEDAGAGAALGFRTYRAWNGELPASIDACDAWLITGSRQSVYDDDPWILALGELVRELHRARRTLVGVCFGHQLVAHVLGGRTALAPVGWCVGVQETRISLALPWMEPFQPALKIAASHRDQVVALPERAQVFAESDRCPVGGFVLDEHILAIQAHPEFGKPYARALLERRRKVVGEQVYERAVATFDQPIDQPLVGRWMRNFILQPNRTRDRPH